MNPLAQQSDSLRAATAALRMKRFQTAEQICLGILKHTPNAPDALYLLAVSHLERRDPGSALKYLKKALRASPRTASLHAARAQAHLSLGEFEEAAKSFEAAVTLEPNAPRVLLGQGEAMMHLGRFAQAVSVYTRALRLDPRNADAFNNRGYALQQLGRPVEALANYTRAVSLHPKFAEALNNRGNALQELKRRGDAIRDYDGAIAARPGYESAFNNKANALVALGQSEEALQCVDHALALNPNYAQAYNNKGYALQRLSRHHEALECLDRAIAMQPNYPEAHNNRGHSLHQLMRFDEAMASYQRAIDLRPHYPEAIWNRGLLKLLIGDLTSGWSDIEWRWQCKSFQEDPRAPGIPEWRGEAIAGRTITVFAEQGYGDTFQFCRYISLLLEAGAKVRFAAPRSVHRLLSTLSPEVQLQHMLRTDVDSEFQCTLLSLPDRFGTSLESVPAEVPYLRAEPDLIEQWRRRIGAEGFKIGLTWQGNPTGSVDIGRSIPLALLEPLSRIPGVRLISLQVMHGLDQLDRLPAGMKVEELRGFNEGPDAFIDTAAAMHCVDLVLTTDTAPAHLAGALGLPVWVMLMQVPDWRWLMNRTDSPWYPTMRLFRQHQAGDWGSVVGDIVRTLTDQLETSNYRGFRRHRAIGT